MTRYTEVLGEMAVPLAWEDGGLRVVLERWADRVEMVALVALGGMVAMPMAY